MAEFMADDVDWLRVLARTYPAGPSRARLIAVAEAIADALSSSSGAANPPCAAALNLAGEHFPCDWPTDENGRHDGWAHASSAASAVWKGVE